MLTIFLFQRKTSLRFKFLGGLHELKDKVTLLDIKDIGEFYEFKGRFKWLERRFGLRPT